MDLKHDLFGHVFAAASASTQNESKNNTTIIDKNITRQFQSLEFENAKREKAIAEKKKHIKPRIEFMSSDRAGELVQGEMTKILEKKRWKGLDMCFKWKIITQYLAMNNIVLTNEELDTVRDAVRRNQLQNVKYDHITGTILKMNFDVGNQSL